MCLTRSCVPRLCAGIALACVALASAAQTRSMDRCSARAQGDLRACLEAEVRASEAVLKAAEDAADAALTRWDEDAKYRVSASAALQSSRQSFSLFRETQCAFSAALGGGAIGNALAVRRLACIGELNRQQAAWLKQAVAGLPAQ
jgi:uncharacterized protein YecT (DUF1311 family)